MPFSAGPNIAARQNLVFEYDLGDVQNSYKGEPTTNQYTNPAFTNGTTGWTFGSWDSGNFTYTVENILGPFGQVIPALKITRTGSSTYAHFHQNNGGKYTTGNQYTLSAYVIGAGTLRGNSQWGDSVSLTLSSQWQRVSYTVTAPNNSLYPYWAAEAITQNVPMYFVFAQSEQKSHVTPYIDGTRSNTQGLLDISGAGNTVTLSNMSYTSAAQPTFDGTDDYISTTLFPSVPSVMSAEFVFYKTTSSNTDLSYQGFAPRFALRSNQINLYHATAGQTGDINFACTINTNTYYHVVLTFDAVNKYQCYLNTVSLSRSYNGDAANGVPGFTTTLIGYVAGSEGYFAGSIPVCRYYNYALSAQEVLRNYNQLKTRFNLL
jgi:hypothetical protein